MFECILVNLSSDRTEAIFVYFFKIIDSIDEKVIKTIFKP